MRSRPLVALVATDHGPLTLRATQHPAERDCGAGPVLEPTAVLDATGRDLSDDELAALGTCWDVLARDADWTDAQDADDLAAITPAHDTHRAAGSQRAALALAGVRS